jgi:DNA-binding transcriptional LysR family regulator
MKNWDDIRYFLAVTRASSLRIAARSLGVSRSTILRRITALETRMGARLFDRQPTGYYITGPGESLLATAIEIEKLALSADRELLGHDDKLAGNLRVSVPAAILGSPMIAAFSDFMDQHPAIRLELVTSYTMANLFRREADIAIRISNDPPDELVGRKLFTIARSCYAASSAVKAGKLKAGMRWIGWSVDATAVHWPDFADSTGNHVDKIGSVITDPFAAIEAIKAEIGVALLPCFFADHQEGLIRVPPASAVPWRDLWILTHRDLLKTARIRTFLDFMAAAFLEHKALFEGTNER